MIFKNLFSFTAMNNETIANEVFIVNIQKFTFGGLLPIAGITKALANQPADKFISQSENAANQ